MDKDLRKIFSEKFREAVKMSGTSYTELAQKLGVNKSTVSMYAHGNALPSLEIFSEIATLLDVSADFLLGKNDL